MKTITEKTITELRHRLKLADSVADEQGVSLYLVALGCLYLAVEDGNDDERATLELLFRAQCEAEQVIGTDIETQDQKPVPVDSDEVLQAISNAIHELEPS